MRHGPDAWTAPVLFDETIPNTKHNLKSFVHLGSIQWRPALFSLWSSR